jgi:hypothetical protein
MASVEIKIGTDPFTQNPTPERMKNHLFAILTLALLGNFAIAQNITSTSLRQNDDQLIINYTLSGLSSGKGEYADVELFVSIDEGVTFVGPLKAVSGDVGAVRTNGSKSITWNVFSEFNSLKGDVVFDVRAKILSDRLNNEGFIAYNFSETSQYGFMIGSVIQWGGYFKLKSNGVFNKTTENFQSDLLTVIDGRSDSRFGVTAGGLYRYSRRIYLYAGAGYGYRVVFSSASIPLIIDDKWSDLFNNNSTTLTDQYNTKSYDGFESEVGVMYRLNRLFLAFGMNTINLDFFELNGALGFFF